MSAESYNYAPVSKETQTAFRIEYGEQVSDGEIWDDVVSYLGEYRFQIPQYSYQLQFNSGEDGMRIRDSHRGESMHEKAQKALSMRYESHLNASREEAEVTGIVRLEEMLHFAKMGDKVVWASPPGDPEEGYGDYGFVYYGEIEKDEKGEADLSMTALRVEGKTLSSYNKLFSNITGEKNGFETAEQFIASPMVIRDITKEELITEIENVFGTTDGDSEVFVKTIQHMAPAIREFIRIARNGDNEEKKRAFNALENYALEVKSRLENGIDMLPPVAAKYPFENLVNTYGFEPPEVKGSCGTSELKTPNIMKFMITSIVGEDEHGSLQFECPHCGSVNTRPRGELLSHCQSCEKSVAC